MIVLEGPDGGGKSFLANLISKATDWPIVRSEGPPKSRGEFLDRIDRYFKMGRAIVFDRHPVISNIVYDRIRPPDKRLVIPEPTVERFYACKPLFIYARSLSPARALEDNPDADTPEHVALYKTRYLELVKHYDDWALDNAHYIHRIEQDYSGIITASRMHSYRVMTGKHE